MHNPGLNCFIELKPLTDLLRTENGIYVPANNFGQMMKETRLNLNLAYGLKTSEFGFILSLLGVNRLLSCIIKNKEDVMHNFDLNIAN